MVRYRFLNIAIILKLQILPDNFLDTHQKAWIYLAKKRESGFSVTINADFLAQTRARGQKFHRTKTLHIESVIRSNNKRGAWTRI